MELSGNLSDFALADILQILALSRKTGKLSLESNGLKGRVLIEEGKIVSVSISEGGEIKDLRAYLVEVGLINVSDLDVLERLILRTEREWSFEALLIESGLVLARNFDRMVRQYLQEAVGRLLMIRKGRFGIILNQRNHIGMSVIVGGFGGLDIGEVLLEAAIKRDEVQHDVNHPEHSCGDTARCERTYKQNDKDYWEPAIDYNEGVDRVWDASCLRSNRFYSMLAELRSYCFETEISLMILRCASEIASRGILFIVQEEGLIGFGQFGFCASKDQQKADQLVRDIMIPLNSQGVIAGVARTGKPYCGMLGEPVWDREMLKMMKAENNSRDEPRDKSAFAAALLCDRKTRFVIYGESISDYARSNNNKLIGFEEFVLFINQASMTLEKLVVMKK